MGWAVFPVHGIVGGKCTCGRACKRPGKHPVTVHGLKDASGDQKVIDGWWARHPAANIGIATGAISGICALDVDVVKGGEDSLDRLIATHGQVPNTVEAITGSGGRHLLFRHPGRPVKNSVESLGPGIDFRGDGGYIVVAPSRHISGNAYAWEASSRPGEAELADLPPWLLQAVTERREPPEPQETNVTLHPAKVREIRAMLAYIDPDSRDTWLEVGMALHSTGAGNQAYGLWSEWSQQSDKYDAVDQARTWKGLHPDGGITLASLYARAKQEGYCRREERHDEPPQHGDWRDNLARTGRGQLKITVMNLALILEHDEALKGGIRLNTFANRLEIGRALPFKSLDHPEWRDTDSSEATAWLEQHYGWSGSTRKVHEAVCMVAGRHPYHPVVTYLSGLKWDGVERLKHIFEDHFGASSTVFSQALGQCWMVSAVARVMQPGCQVNFILVLEGEQQIGKTTAIRTLFSPWYAESLESPLSKDFYQSLLGKWGVEIAELDSFKRAEVTKVKQVITSTSDYYRPSYGLIAREFPRQCVFVATTNEDKYLLDASGALRFMPIRCTAIALDALASTRDQLWAEAVAAYRTGLRWWDIPRAAAIEEQASRYQEDAWEELIEEFLKGHKEVTLQQVLRDSLHIEVARQDRSAQTRVGAILRHLGWRPDRQISVSGFRPRVYKPLRE